MTEIRRPTAAYGTDAPPVIIVSALGGLTFGLAAATRTRRRRATTTMAALLLANAGIHLHTSWLGKFRIWDRELDRLGLTGNEVVLDLGCGRGAVLVAVAKRVFNGRATGVDRWTMDQSGNSREATLRNATRAGVADRVEVVTADITALPFADDSFDLVTSALAIHNIRSQHDRLRALDEGMRVLRPGGRLLIADITHMAKQYAEHLGQGSVQRLGPGYWYGGPWFGVSMLSLIKAPNPSTHESTTEPEGQSINRSRKRTAARSSHSNVSSSAEEGVR